MLVSMTGYGHAQAESKTYTMNVMIRSLNSKYMDCSMRLPSMALREEPAWRKQLEERLLRGKISVHAQIEAKDLGTSNTSLAAYYDKLCAEYEKITQQSRDAATNTQLFLLAAREPKGEVVESSWADEDKLALSRCFGRALEQLLAMREKEGAKTQEFIMLRITEIETLVAQVEKVQPKRDEELATRLREGISSWLGEDADSKRFEEALFYYVEKNCFAEEIERLQAHIAFFKEAIEKTAQGKRLLFITQEMVREMNTLGAKANDATIQQAVVGMKTEAARIKEQLQNVL